MFRILHTADWHLGKIFHQHSLEEDQKSFLDQIILQLKKARDEKKAYDALLVSGDVYDKATPSEKAMEMLEGFEIRVSQEFPELEMFFIAGNHDSSRIAHNSSFMDAHRIHLRSETDRICDPVVLEKNGESLAVYQLPYLNQYSLEATDEESGEKRRLRTQTELVSEAVSRIKNHHNENLAGIPCILNAHLTTTGSLKSEYDENVIGTIESVDTSLFSFFNYTALGHIHKFQKCGGGNVYYSGSPLAYYFDSSPETFMLDVTLADGKTEVRKIPFVPLHRVTRLQGKIEEILMPEKISRHKDDFVEVLYDDAVLSEDARTELKKNYSYVLSIRRQVPEREKSRDNLSFTQREESLKNPSDYFDAFFKDVFDGVIEDEDLHEKAKDLFVEIAAEVEKKIADGEDE